MQVDIHNIEIPIDVPQEEAILEALDIRGVAAENIAALSWNRRSLDMRQKRRLKFLYSLRITLKMPANLAFGKDIVPVPAETPEIRAPKYPGREVVVIGAGPAGLFAALRLTRYGCVPLVYEMGEPVDARTLTTARFIREGILDSRSNIQFGEGGAGTFSDGKLNTRIKSSLIADVFEELVAAGADPRIRWDYKPHLGTDVLKTVVTALRKMIEATGGRFFFGRKMEELVIKEGRVAGIQVADPKGAREFVPCDCVILATGHSSRETYRMLGQIGCAMAPKPFAMGFRMEHRQEDIDRMQYGPWAGHPALGPATYSVTYHNKRENRGVFSFCMCPGGEIVNAASNPGASLVNGMSEAARAGKFANAGLVAGIGPADLGPELFAGMELQERLERQIYALMGTYGALWQNMEDFLTGTPSRGEIKTSYRMSLKPYPLGDLLPPYLTANIRAALLAWQEKYPGFAGKNANLFGLETRTSSPLRILRDENGESLNIKGLFPVGEGAGYAGGITSSAVDGIGVVDRNFSVISL
ncbi:MAG: NAD(P)/FAD-dependent oxidoreductase [Fusobacteriaceae bacterium]|jgi:uncharacterized FAD-dependent dehydrogenase|nr:NAD(P)/FAD-dependent oxidoreductase [Fusobacteriaceae bacterium]